MPRLIIFCGIPGSGKTYCYKHNPGLFDMDSAVRLSLDEFRLLMTGKDFHPPFEPVVQAWVEQTGRYLLSQGRDVAIDATYVRKSLRMKWLRIAGDYEATTCCVWLNTPWHVCVERNEKRERKVPVEVLRRMSEDFETPNYLEGYEKIAVVDENGVAKILERKE